MNGNRWIKGVKRSWGGEDNVRGGKTGGGNARTRMLEAGIDDDDEDVSRILLLFFYIQT